MLLSASLFWATWGEEGSGGTSVIPIVSGEAFQAHSLCLEGEKKIERARKITYPDAKAPEECSKTGHNQRPHLLEYDIVSSVFAPR